MLAGTYDRLGGSGIHRVGATSDANWAFTLEYSGPSLCIFYLPTYGTCSQNMRLAYARATLLPPRTKKKGSARVRDGWIRVLCGEKGRDFVSRLGVGGDVVGLTGPYYLAERSRLRQGRSTLYRGDGRLQHEKTSRL